MAPSLQDLRRIFYGAGPDQSVSDAEYNFLKNAQTAGISATQLVTLATAPSGRELAYADSAVVMAGPIAAATDITGLAPIQFTVGARPVHVEIFDHYVFASGAAANGFVQITDLANAVYCTGAVDLSAAGKAGCARASLRFSVQGTYNVKGRIGTVAGNVGRGLGGGFEAATRVSIRAIEA